MYFLIGISLLFGCFYAVHFTASLAAVSAWKVVRSRVANWPGRRRSNLLCAIRIAPVALAAIISFAFVLPAFVAFEPFIPNETVGYKLAIIVSISAAGLTAALARIFAAWWQTRRLVREWMRTSSPQTIDGAPAYRIGHEFPVLAVVGIFRPRVFVAEKVLEELAPAELQASMAHEMGHVASRDNLKRTAMRLCSDLLVLPIAKRLDRDWYDATEAAADQAAADKGLAALDLASALVKIGRLVPKGNRHQLPVGAYLIEPDDGSLARRIETLVDMPHGPLPKTRSRITTAIAYAAVLVSGTAILSLSLNSSFLSLVHDTSEKILHALQ
jgi:hypothetical protein